MFWNNKCLFWRSTWLKFEIAINQFYYKVTKLKIPFVQTLRVYHICEKWRNAFNFKSHLYSLGRTFFSAAGEA